MKKMTLLVGCFVLVCLSVWVVSSAKNRPAARTSPQAINSANLPAASPSPVIARAARAGLSLPLQGVLQTLGDRLERAGKERLIMQGTINRPHLSSARQPIRLILERPERLRLEEQSGNSLKVTMFDGTTLARQGEAFSPAEESEIESLVFDSVEHFFLGEMRGQATRFIGSNFRLDNGSSVTYTGPFYDVYETTDRVNLGRGVREQAKHYFINSNTLLLEKISYQLMREGSPVRIEVQLNEWRNFPNPQQPGDWQLIPTTIARLENGKPVMVLNVNAASVVAGVADGIFRLPAQ